MAYTPPSHRSRDSGWESRPTASFLERIASQSPPTEWGPLPQRPDARHGAGLGVQRDVWVSDSVEMGHLGDYQTPPVSAKRALLDSINPHSSGPYSRLESPPPPQPRSKPGRGRQPFHSWLSKWIMYIGFVFGIACAIGHHIFYSTLDKQPATDQLVMQRYGTLLAFGAKAGFSTTVVTAFHQRVWVTVKKRMLSVGALDALFSITEDLEGFTSWEMISAAKIAVLLAVFVWVAPLVVILTANTLQVQLSRIEAPDRCPGIRTLNFTMEEFDEWRNPTKIGKYYEIPASLWNTTKRPDDRDDDDWFDYFTAPGPTVVQTLTIGAFMGETVMRRNAQTETCGSGWNCTFEIKFIAPAYKCTELASGVGSKPVNLTQESGSIAPPFSLDILVPKGLFTYYAFASGGQYSGTQMDDVEPGGIPKSKRPDPRNLGAFRTEPIIWIGYASRVDGSKPLPATRSEPGWNEAFVPKLFACENYEASYTVTFNYTDGFLATNVTNLEFLKPVINTTYLPGVESRDGTADNVTATPQSNYVFPRDKRQYRRAAAFHSLGLIARSFINGTMTINAEDANGVPLVNTDAIQTKLLDVANMYLPQEDLMSVVQRFYEDIILSMLSNPQFASVVWAAKPDTQSGTGKTIGELQDNDDLKYPCQRSRVANVYKYLVRDLWIVYGVSFILSLIGLIVGALAVRENSSTKDTRFSSIVASTRGGALDKLEWDDGTPAARIPQEVKGARVGYGLVGSTGLRPDPDEGYSSSVYTGKRFAPRYGFALEGDLTKERRRSFLEGTRFGPPS
ncbi:hypothetical protein OQA88_9387 [Cercophora sp. LCS_1]